MRLCVIFMMFTFLSACAAGMIDKQMSVNTNLRAKMFNSVASQYIIRPTFVDLNIAKSGDKILDVKVTDYLDNIMHLLIYYKDMPVYLNVINKYLEWEEKATINGHVFDKVIATYRTPNGFSYSFAFHSGNKYDHYLSIGSNLSLMDEHVSVFVFDRENALILRNLILNGYTSKVIDISSQYQWFYYILISRVN